MEESKTIDAGTLIRLERARRGLQIALDALIEAKTSSRPDDGSVVASMESRLSTLVSTERAKALKRLIDWRGLLEKDDFEGNDATQAGCKAFWEGELSMIAKYADEDANLALAKIESLSAYLDDFNADHYYIREEIQEAMEAVLLRRLPE